MKKIILSLVTVLFVVSLVACVSQDQQGESTQRTFNIGMEYHTLPETEEEYIARFARQLAVYNQRAPYIWINNPFTNMSALIGNLNNKDQFWFISPDGAVRELTREEASAERPYKDFSDDSLFWDEMYGEFFEEGSGFYSYIDMSDGALAMPPGRGDIEHTSLLLHGAAHSITFVVEFDNPFRGMVRYERFFDTEARLMRDLINTQLLDALANPDDINYILKLLSTFVHYKEHHPEDYLLTKEFDVIEGLSNWFDITGSLFAAYPDQIQTDKDLHAAISYLARYHREGTWLTEYFGAVTEAYMLGALAGFLLDMHIDRFEWQGRLYEVATNPLQMLLEHFENENLPAFNHVFSQQERDTIERRFNERTARSSITLGDFLALLKETLTEYTFAPADFEELFIEDDEMQMIVEALGWDKYHVNILVTREVAENVVGHVLGVDVSFDFVVGNQIPNAPASWVPSLLWADAFAIMEYLGER